MNTYEVTTKEGRTFTITAYSNFHAGTKAQSIGGSGCTVKLTKKYRVPGGNING